MRAGVVSKRVTGGLGLALILSATPLWAAEVSGPEPGLAAGQDKRAVGSNPPSTVYRDPDGTPYVLKGASSKQYLSGYNVTWIDKNHVIAPQGVGGFD